MSFPCTSVRYSRRCVLFLAAWSATDAFGAGKKRAQPAPPPALARQWRVALRVVRAGTETGEGAQGQHYRSDTQPAAPQMELVVVEGERARWALAQTQGWVWTDAAWSGAAAAPGAAPGGASGSTGGVVQSQHSATLSQVLECEVLAQGQAAAQRVRVRVVWQEPTSGAMPAQPQTSARVELDSVLWVTPLEWFTLARSGPAAVADASGARHWGTRSSDTASWQLQLRLERVTP